MSILHSKIVITTSLTIIGLWLALSISTFLFPETPNLQPSKESGQISVIATIYPLAYFADGLSPNATVTTIVGPGKEPHDYELTIDDAKMIHDANMVIVNGNVDDWAWKSIKGEKTVSALTSLNLPLTDPHVWLDPVYAKQIVRNIGAYLEGIDPAYATIIAQNTDKKVAAIAAIDAAYKEGLATCKIREIVSTHEAFNFLATRYNFKVHGIMGLNPHEEPSAKSLASMTDLIKSRRINTVFFESFPSENLAKTLAAETGAKSDVLNTIESLSPGYDQSTGYFAIMMDNLVKLRSAMLCQ